MSVARVIPENVRVLTVVGNRPQFIKAAAVSHRLRDGAEEVLVHTGQHYDEELSQVFFSELGLPRARAPPRARRRLQHGADGAHARGARGPAGERAARPRARLRRHELDARGRAGRRAGADPGRPRGGRHALVRPRDARGAQPRADRPRVVAAAVLVGERGRAPARRARRRAHRGGRRRDGRHRAAAGPARRGAHRGARGPRRATPGAFLLVTAHRAGNVDDPARLERLVALLEALPDPASSRCTRAPARGSRPRGCSTGSRRPALRLTARSATSSSPRCCTTPAPC